MLLPKFRAFEGPFLCSADVIEKEASVSATDVTITTTTEKVAITSAPLTVPKPGCRAHIKGWAQITTGTNTTTVKPRIRRGSAITGTLVNEANAETIKAAAGSTEVFYTRAIDNIGDVGEVTYSLTFEQAGASADGSILQSGIEVEILG